MKKSNPKLIIIISSAIIGLFIASQMKLNLELITPVTVKSIITAKNELSAAKIELIELEKLVEQKSEELYALQNIATGEDNIIDIIESDLKMNKMKAGYTKLEGPGIEIIMFDNLLLNNNVISYNDDIIHDVDILNIINDLKVAGAEAICINEERIISISEIKCGGPIIRVNDRSLGAPFTIKAIGDPKVLMAAVNAPGTYGDTLRTIYGIGLEPYIVDKLVIPSYKGIFTFNFAKPMEEGE
ncbi:MAG: DUF881 domain-containing protein [Gudongella sp.]|nr:DUF881 domain-containing protein [Gudongella sp.]